MVWKSDSDLVSSNDKFSSSFKELRSNLDNELTLESLNGSNTKSSKEVSDLDWNNDNSNFKSNGISSRDRTLVGSEEDLTNGIGSD